MSNKSIALMYAQNGVSVFPCIEGDSTIRQNAKAPYISGGFKGASKDIHQITAWWTKWPDAAVGLPCRPNGIVVLDADRHGGDNGVAALLNLFARNNFDVLAIPTVATPRNGLHFLFNSATIPTSKALLLPAVDIRDNAYVLAAGTEMAKFLHYSLQRGSIAELAEAIGAGMLPQMPNWLLRMVRKEERTSKREHSRVSRSDVINFNQIAGLVRKIAEAPTGTRNSTLYWGARRLGELVEYGVITYEEAYAIATEAGCISGLEWREVTASVHSALSGSHK